MYARFSMISIFFVLLSVSLAHADINAYIHDLNISVQGDIGGFKAKLGARFGTTDSYVEAVFRSVDSPAEAAVVFWLGEQSQQPIDRVLTVYRSHKAQGWGVIAKSLGIKPGSAAFHALKKGDIQLSLDNNRSKGKGKKKNKHG